MPAVNGRKSFTFGARKRKRGKPRGIEGGRPHKTPAPPSPSRSESSEQSPSSSPSQSPGPSPPEDSDCAGQSRLLSPLPTPDTPKEDELTAIERKMEMLRRDECSGEPLGLGDSGELEGYRLLEVSCVKALVGALLCPECAGSCLELKESGKGALLGFIVECPSCGEVASAPHSSNIGDTRQNELSARIGLAARDCGIGFTKLSNLFSGMNVPPPMCLKSSQKIASKVHDAATKAASKVMQSAAQSVRKAEKSGDDELLDVCISYDGTWHKRGHTSHFGVGVAVELNSGLVIDYSVQSNYCQVCAQGPKPGSQEYEEWFESHSPDCQKNFQGSAHAMEVEAASVIFGRSVERHNMQYTTVLCDGDSKAFSKVASLGLYDKEVKKEDCINHVAKRMYAGLDALKKAKKGLGGKGKLTNVKMKQLTNYYACALKDNAPDVPAMQRGVFATLLHSYSTDDEPRHTACPTGRDSWCHFNRSKALEAAGEPPASRPHKPAFSRELAKELVPVYNRLSRSDLLERCSRMKTQNANESFNALVWKRCPKVEFASLKTVESAVALAVLEFNLGPRGFEHALSEMGIKPGSHHTVHAAKATQKKIGKAQKKELESSKASHKRRKMEAVAKAQKDREEEGLTYGPGAF